MKEEQLPYQEIYCNKIQEKVTEYVMEHLSEEVKRDDIANALYFNPTYFSHIFKQKTGISLTRFVNQLRIREAKRLLDTTDLSVGNVAMDTGYYNFSYFSKQFKEMYRVTPREYKKSSGQNLSCQEKTSFRTSEWSRR
jgi:two-component system response regulator YesN